MSVEATSKQASTTFREVRAVTLDAAGTLFHAPRVGEIYSEILERHGHEIEIGEMSAAIERVWEEFDCRIDMGVDRWASHAGGARGWWADFAYRLAEHLEIDRPSSFAIAELFARFSRADAWSVYSDVLPALEQLKKKGARLAIVSNFDKRLPGLVDRLGLGDFFEVVVYSEAEGVEKPHPRIFERALELLGCRPGEALHAGDRERDDVEGAVAVGMQGALIDRSGRRSDLRDLEVLAARVSVEPR